MLRIIGKISILGDFAITQQLESKKLIPNGLLQQVGARRPIPADDLWCYGSNWFSFRFDSLDEEILNYLIAHERLGDALAVAHTGVKYALLTVTPVGQTYEETFSCLFGVKTLRKLSDLRLALEIAPESVMPDVPYWIEAGGR